MNAPTMLIDAASDRKLWLPGSGLPARPYRPQDAHKRHDVRVEAPFSPSVEVERFRQRIERQISEALRQAQGSPLNLGLRRLLPIGGGAAGAWTFTNTGRTSLIDGTFAVAADTFKMALFLSTSNLAAASTTYAALTNEHANSYGYTTGGISVDLTLAGTTTVTADIATDPVWTASGGSIVAKFAVIYEVSGNVICYCLLDSGGADVTVTTGNTLTVAAHASGLFTLA